jgi:hypothetical protein
MYYVTGPRSADAVLAKKSVAQGVLTCRSMDFCHVPRLRLGPGLKPCSCKMRRIVPRRDVVKAEFLQLAENTAAATAGGLGHRDDQLADLFRPPGPASLATLDTGPILARRAGECPGMDDCDDVLDLRVSLHAELHELASFGQVDFDPPRKLLAENPVLRLQAFDPLDNSFPSSPGQE